MELTETTTFNELFDGSYKKVKDYAKSVCKNPSDAEDITQEAFIRAFRFLHTFDNRSSIDAWLIRIARNQYLDSVRRSRRRVQTISIESDTSESTLRDERDFGYTSESLFANFTQDSDLAQAIEQLEMPQRILLQLIAIEQHPYTEVAQKLDIPVCTVKSRYSRALKEARKGYQALTNKSKIDRMNAGYALA